MCHVIRVTLPVLLELAQIGSTVTLSGTPKIDHQHSLTFFRFPK
jgi:hypothetical protein